MASRDSGWKWAPLAVAVAGLLAVGTWKLALGRISNASARMLCGAIYATVTLAVLAMPTRRQQVRGHAAPRVSIVLLVLGVGLLRILVVERPSDHERGLLIADGIVVVQQLERFHAAHGRFPCATKGDELSLPRSSFGSWEYRPLENCSAYSLKVGDYRDDGFTLSWSSGREDWYWDT